MEYVPFRWDQYEWEDTTTEPTSVAPPRYYHTAVVVGRFLYVFGGTTGSSINSPFTKMTALDCETMKWHVIDADGPTPYNRSSATACALGEEHFVVFGGYPYYQNSPNTLFTFDTVHHKWQLHSCNGVPPPRRANCCPAYNKDKIYYTAASLHFLRISDIIEKPSNHDNDIHKDPLWLQNMTHKKNDKYSVEHMDQNQQLKEIIQTDHRLNELDDQRSGYRIREGPFRWHHVRCKGRGAAQTASHDAAVYVPSKDIIISISNYSFTQSVCYFDFKDHLWKAASCNMYNPYPIHSHCISNIGDYILLFGGYSRNGRSNETWILNTNTWQWTELRHINDVNTSKTSAIVNGHLYKTQRLRGSSDSPAALASSDALIPSDSSNNIDDNDIEVGEENQRQVSEDDSIAGAINVKFTGAGKAPPYRWGHSMNVYDENKVFVFGGYNGRRFANDVWVFSTGYKPGSCSSFKRDIRELFFSDEILF